MTFTADPDGDAITIYYYVNGIINDTTTTNTTFNGTDGTYILNVSLFDTVGFSENVTALFILILALSAFSLRSLIVSDLISGGLPSKININSMFNDK